MTLIKQIRHATEVGDLKEPFTVQDIKKWIKKMNIVKDDGSGYAESSINAILSNSDIKNAGSSNKNGKVLESDIDDTGNIIYWFKEKGMYQ